MKKQPLIVVLVLVALIGAFILVRQANKPKPVANPFSRESPAHLPFEDFVKTLTAIPNFERKLQAAARNTDPTTLGFEIAQNGLKRLSDAQLDRRMELIVKLVEYLDVATCASLSRADPALAKALAPKLLRALENMTASDIRAFFDLTAQAVEAELNRTPFPAYVQSRSERALRILVGKFSAEEQAVLKRVIGYPSMSSHESGCWVVKTVFAEIMDLPVSERHALSRMFVLSAEGAP
ncbi:MAG: hypothetical protein ABI790_07810 [Betaproteobacteria bacterium]